MREANLSRPFHGEIQQSSKMYGKIKRQKQEPIFVFPPRPKNIYKKKHHPSIVPRISLPGKRREGNHHSSPLLRLISDTFISNARFSWGCFGWLFPPLSLSPLSGEMSPTQTPLWKSPSLNQPFSSSAFLSPSPPLPLRLDEPNPIVSHVGEGATSSLCSFYLSPKPWVKWIPERSCPLSSICGWNSLSSFSFCHVYFLVVELSKII